MGSRESTGTAGLGDLRDWLAWYRTHTQKVAKQAHIEDPLSVLRHILCKRSGPGEAGCQQAQQDAHEGRNSTLCCLTRLIRNVA